MSVAPALVDLAGPVWTVVAGLSSHCAATGGGPLLAPVAQQGGLPAERSLLVLVARLGGFAGLSFTLALTAALGYRWYTRELIPLEVTLLLGTAVVAFYLGVVGIFDELVGGGADGLFALDAVLTNVLSLVVAAVVTPSGRRVGDRIATDVFAMAGAREVNAEVSRLVRHVGRVEAVELPDSIDDIDGYDPVSAETKEAMAGKTLLFPRRQSVEERRDRLATRLKDDYGVGYVDAEFDDAGRLQYLAVGSRVAGLGPTLAPGTVAVAVRADPAYSASPGDTVQVWTTGPDPTRVTTADLRGAVDDVATLAVDESDAAALSPEETYRLVTLPVEPRASREFATLLRAADETMAAVRVAPDSDLVGSTVGELDVTVTAVHPASEPVELLPNRDRPLAVGDTLYVVARPEALRRLDVAAEATLGESEVRRDGRPLRG